MTPTTIRVDSKVKQKAQKLAKQIGFSFNDLVSVLLNKAVREGGIDLRHVQLTENGFTPGFEENIIRAQKEGGSKEFKSIDEMIKYAKKYHV